MNKVNVKRLYKIIFFSFADNKVILKSLFVVITILVFVYYKKTVRTFIKDYSLTIN